MFSSILKKNEISSNLALEKILQVEGYCFSSVLSGDQKNKISSAFASFSRENVCWSVPFVAKKFLYLNNNCSPFIWENLPFYSSKKIRKELNSQIFKEVKSLGVPLVQKWYWPNGCRSFFSFRADMDAGDEASLLRFVENIRPWSKSLSLFVCGKAYVGKEHLLKEVVGLESEVGNHTFVHYVFSDKELNRKNLELTEALLSGVGIVPKGYVGPASFWHPSMYEILEEKGYQYTSSFGVSHDDFPLFLPKIDSEAYSMVEIPFHCLGDRFPKFGLRLDAEEVGRFFDQLLEKKYHSCEPMFIYGHPDMPGRMGDFPQLVTRIFQKAFSYEDVCTGNMADIASWWKKRHEARANIFFDREKNLVIAKDYHGADEVYWSIQLAEDCKYLVSGEDLRRGIQLDSLEIYKKVDMTDFPNKEVGEVIVSPPEKQSLRKRVDNYLKEYRRKKRMLRELNLAVR